MTEKIYLEPIGRVHAAAGSTSLEIYEPFRDALLGLEQFSHVLVFWWAHGCDTGEQRQITQVDLPYAPGLRKGVFACRSERRPNPLALTTCYVLQVDVENGLVLLPWIDAQDGSPLLDLKPFIPTSDRVRDFQVAPWMADWPEWMEDAAAYFEKHAVDFGD
jgi:tRNA-Thr(GGU) m(6)t(6)A37 methyltransferase TsaA